ncbi:MAG TPA: GNAT family N-acetyltransferase [Candidatus Acidoferrales bacterium]|nr:GNAT family N-acetyltransferase [Candidatus Acidoferrales bacterium]
METQGAAPVGQLKITVNNFHTEPISMTVRIRPANRADLPRLTEIYNYYVIHTPVTFDLEPYTVERRSAWFDQFALTGRYRLLVAEEDGLVLGYAGTMRFRPKAAYDTTVETTVYSSKESMGKGIGRKLYAGLFEALAGENINRIVGGYTLPNAASAKLHEMFGFKSVGIFSEVGYKFGKYWDVAWTERPLRISN